MEGADQAMQVVRVNAEQLGCCCEVAGRLLDRAEDQLSFALSETVVVARQRHVSRMA